MKKTVNLVILNRMDGLIRRQATGNPTEFANRLSISLRSLHEHIKFLREEMKAPLRYNMYITSYMYDYPPNFYLGYEKDRFTQSKPEGDVGA